jgi:hypothetical protein
VVERLAGTCGELEVSLADRKSDRVGSSGVTLESELPAVEVG